VEIALQNEGTRQYIEKRKLVAASIPFPANDCISVRETPEYFSYTATTRHPGQKVLMALQPGCERWLK
jgi:hypothetical protein